MKNPLGQFSDDAMEAFNEAYAEKSRFRRELERKYRIAREKEMRRRRILMGQDPNTGRTRR